MYEISNDDLSQVCGGGPLDTISSLITIGQALYQMGSYFAQDNGGPDPIYVYGA